VFKGIAKTGKSTMGYFYGFKLHIIINEKGEIPDFTKFRKFYYKSGWNYRIFFSRKETKYQI